MIKFGSDEAKKLLENDRVLFANQDKMTEKYGSKDSFLKELQQQKDDLESERSYYNSLNDEDPSEKELSSQKQLLDDISKKIQEMEEEGRGAGWL